MVQTPLMGHQLEILKERGLELSLRIIQVVEAYKHIPQVASVEAMR